MFTLVTMIKQPLPTIVTLIVELTIIPQISQSKMIAIHSLAEPAAYATPSLLRKVDQEKDDQLTDFLFFERTPSFRTSGSATAIS